jgi:two-component sensor histidine kinase/Tfp pilus assembly protein PilF
MSMIQKITIAFIMNLCWLPAFGQLAVSPPDSIQTMSADTNKVKAWIQFSKEAMRENYEIARNYADSALALATEIGYQKGIGISHRQIATASYYGSDLPPAVVHYKKAADYYQSIGEEPNMAKMINNIGLVKRNQGAYDEAMEYFFQALEIKERFDDQLTIASTLQNIGAVYAIKSNFEEAERYFLQAMAAFREGGNERMEHSMILDMGGFYRDQNELEKAMEQVEKARQYFSGNGPKMELGRSYYIRGGIYLDQQKYPSSRLAYLHSKSIFDSLGATMRSVGCIYQLAEVALAQGQYAKALNLAKESLSLSKEIQTNSQIIRALNQLARVNKATGNYKTALSYTEESQLLHDSLFNAETERTIAELEEKYQSEVKERQLAGLKAENEMNELRIRKKNNQNLGLLLFLALFLIIVILLYNQYRINRRNHQLLLEKSNLIQANLDEKEVLLREIHHRVKNNLQFISSLLNLQSRHVGDPQTRQVLDEGRYRIQSMALVHQKLYQEDNLKGVEMPSYISNLIETLVHSYQVDRNRIQVTMDLDEVRLDIDSATPIGLILNELITNAFKYAFVEQKTGELAIKLKEQNDHLELSVRDNGRGFPKGFQLENNLQFGWELIQSLASRLKASIDVKSEQGVDVRLEITKYKKA